MTRIPPSLPEDPKKPGSMKIKRDETKKEFPPKQDSKKPIPSDKQPEDAFKELKRLKEKGMHPSDTHTQKKEKGGHPSDMQKLDKKGKKESGKKPPSDKEKKPQILLPDSIVHMVHKEQSLENKKAHSLPNGNIQESQEGQVLEKKRKKTNFPSISSSDQKEEGLVKKENKSSNIKKIVEEDISHGRAPVEKDKTVIKSGEKEEKKEGEPEEGPPLNVQPLQAIPGTSQTTPVQALASLPSDIFDIFERLVGVMTIEQDKKGISELTLVISKQGSALDKAEISIKLFDTHPTSFNVELRGSPEAVNYFNQYREDLVAAFQQSKLSFEVRIQTPEILQAKKRVVKKQDSSKKGA